MSETQGGGYPWAVPAEHDSSSDVRASMLRWKQNYRVVNLLVNYICLIFHLYFECLLNEIKYRQNVYSLHKNEINNAVNEKRKIKEVIMLIACGVFY